MNIQISVTLWTIICFVVLMLILNNLLFKPVLRVMDARREKIEGAAAKKARWDAAEQEHAAMLLEKEAAFRSARERQIQDEIEAIRAESRRAVECAKEERVRLMDEFRDNAELEREKILTALSAHKAELAAAFAERLIKE